MTQQRKALIELIEEQNFESLAIGEIAEGTVSLPLCQGS
jgi:hypothetical protein